MTDAIARFKRGRAIAVLAAGLAGLVWVSPLADYAVTSKMRLIAPVLDAVIVPLIDMFGKTPLLTALGVIGALGLAHGLGLRPPQISRPALPSRPRRDRHDAADEPAATPLARRRGLGAMASAHDEDPQATPPRKPRTVAIEEKMRAVMGDDFAITDEIADRAMDLAAEWERRGTPHGEHVDPIAIIRKRREKDRDWSGDRSWFGGLPRLGGQAWPRGKDGSPLPFVAQLDMAEIAAANPDTPLPTTGSLAFFINEGAVLYVPQGEHPQTPAPGDLPHAYEECSYPLPSVFSPVTHPLFPFWPVEPVRLRMPDDLPPMEGGDSYYEAVEAAQQEAIAAVASRSRYSASVSERQARTLEGADTTWWYCADLVLRQLKASLESIPHTIAGREKSIADAQAHRARLLMSKTPDQESIAQSHRFEERMRASIPLVEAEASGLVTFISHVEAFVAGRDPWSKMTAEEVDVLQEVMATARTDFEQLCRYKVSGYLDDLRNAAIRRMITGDQRAVGAIPDAVLAMINDTHRLPPDWQHQMFGLGGCRQDALYEHLCDHLLLQIVYDAMPEFRFGDMGLWQFWISPEALAAGRWDKAELTFECS